MSIDGALQTFIAEVDELLHSMEAALLRMDEGDISRETINEVFRAAHTIKGSAGLFGLDDIVAFTHNLENLLDRVRDEKIAITSDLLNALLPCCDHIATLMENVESNQPADEETRARGAKLLNTLKPWLLNVNAPAEEQASPVSAVVAKPESVTPWDKKSNHDLWHISLRLGRDILKNGMDPLSIFRFLNTMGRIEHITTLTDALPSVDEFDPEQMYLGFELEYRSDTTQTEIENAFMFVQDESHITIIPPRSNIDAYIKLIKSLPENTQKLGEILVNSHVITQQDLEQALAAQKTQVLADAEIPLLGDILVEEQLVPEVLVGAALDKQKKIQERRTAPESRFIRVDSERLDKLINLIGELVISRQRVDLLASRSNDTSLIEATTHMGNFIEHIRDAALTLRMVPVGETFQRFKRVVHDTAKSLGKEIHLEIEGAETELDRSMVEKLADPLMHIVRNAMDHGIECMDVRQARGKPREGTITLNAHHDAGNIVIGISDDGGGLDVGRIQKKAIANGLIDADAVLSDNEIFQLIFHPGLSTAERVTNLSGRGVGMDVVKRNITELQGAIEIDSELGVGTQITIRLPLTLAIIDGFHVGVGSIDFIIPQNTILECVDLASLPHVKGQNCVNLRGDQVPYVRLQELFALTPTANSREKVVVVQFGEKRAGIVVDALHGEIQTVVKPMGPIFKALKGVGGSSLLGTGAVALILDVQQLIGFSRDKEHLRNGSMFEGAQEVLG